MEAAAGLQEIAQMIDVGGNVALLIAVWWIREASIADKLVAERLARIESKLQIQSQPEKQE